MWRTGVADAVFGELLEVGALPALLVALDADFLQAPVAGEPGVAGHLREVRDTRAASRCAPIGSSSSHSRQRDGTRISAGANVTVPRRVGTTA